MALTRLAQKNWLSSSGEKIIICDIQYHDGHSRKLGHFSNYPYILQEGDFFLWDFNDGNGSVSIDNISYIDNLLNIPNIISRIDADVNIGSLEFLNADGKYDNFINYAWEGHPIKIYMGSPSFKKEDFILLIDAVCTSISSQRDNIISLGIRDKKELFNKKIQDKLINLDHLYTVYGLAEANPNDPKFNPNFDPTDLNMYTPPFSKEAINSFTETTAIEVRVDTSQGLTFDELSVLTYNAILSHPAWEAAVDDSNNTIGVASLDSQITEFKIQCTIPGNPIEYPHHYTKDLEYLKFNSAVPYPIHGKTQITIYDLDVAFNHILNLVNLGQLYTTQYFGIYTKYEYFYVWYNFNNTSIKPNKSESVPILFDYDIQESWISDTTLNTPVPIVLGNCFNIEPKLIDIYNHVYQVNDGKIDSILEIRVNGLPISTEFYEVALNIGCFRLLQHNNNMQVTCDVIGNSSQPLNNLPLTPHTAPFMVAWLAIYKAGLPEAFIDDISFTANNISPSLYSTELGLYITSETNLAPIISEIMVSVGGFSRFNRLGILQIFQVTDPSLYTGAIDINITEDDIIENGISLSRTEPPNYNITLGYHKNWTVQDKAGVSGVLHTSDYIDLLDLYSQEFSTVVATNSTIRDEYPLAESTEAIPTLIYKTIDAQKEVSRRRVLRSKKRYIYKIESTAAPLTINIGSIINITHKRYGFEFSKRVLVVGLDEQPTKQRVDMEVWL